MLGDLLRQAGSLHEINEDSWIELRTDAVYRVVFEPEAVVVKVYGNEIRLPDFAKEPLLAALDGPRFRVGDLPGDLDDAGKVVLIRRLVREGLLVHQGASYRST